MGLTLLPRMGYERPEYSLDPRNQLSLRRADRALAAANKGALPDVARRNAEQLRGYTALDAVSIAGRVVSARDRAAIERFRSRLPVVAGRGLSDWSHNRQWGEALERTAMARHLAARMEPWAASATTRAAQAVAEGMGRDSVTSRSKAVMTRLAEQRAERVRVAAQLGSGIGAATISRAAALLTDPVALRQQRASSHWSDRARAAAARDHLDTLTTPREVLKLEPIQKPGVDLTWLGDLRALFVRVASATEEQVQEARRAQAWEEQRADHAEAELARIADAAEQMRADVAEAREARKSAEEAKGRAQRGERRWQTIALGVSIVWPVVLKLLGF